MGRDEMTRYPDDTRGCGVRVSATSCGRGCGFYVHVSSEVICCELRVREVCWEELRGEDAGRECDGGRGRSGEGGGGGREAGDWEAGCVDGQLQQTGQWR